MLLDGDSRFGALMLAYKQEDYIAYSLRSIAPHVGHIVVVYSDRPWTAYNPNAVRQFTVPDRTREILAAMQAEIPKIQIIEGVWRCEEDMRNDGLRALRRLGTEFCITIDADEFYPEGGLQRLKDEMLRRNAPGTAYYVRHANCFRRFDLVIDSQFWNRSTQAWEAERASVGIHLGTDSQFYRTRHLLAPQVKLPEDIFFWHLGYVQSNERMWEKLHTFGHAHEIRSGWFEDIWLRWTPELRDFFFREPHARWRSLHRIDPHMLPTVLHTHPFFDGNHTIGGKEAGGEAHD